MAMWLKRFFDKLSRKAPASELDRILDSADSADTLITSIVPDADPRPRGFARAIEAVHEEWKKWDEDNAQAIFGLTGIVFTIYLTVLLINLLAPLDASLLDRSLRSVIAGLFGLVAGGIFFSSTCDVIKSMFGAYWSHFILSGIAALAGIWLGLPFAVPFALVAGFGAWSVARRIGSRAPILSPEKIREGIGAYFRNLLAEHRERALGEQSEFARIRARLERARDEVARSLDYWRERARQGEQLLASESEKIAERTFERLTDARDSLERQRETIAAFFRECEKRLRDITQGADDYVENARLERLLRETDELVGESGDVASRAAATFMNDIRRFHEALRLLHERVLLSGTRGDTDALEALVERVIAHEAEHQESFQKLETAFAVNAAA